MEYLDFLQSKRIWHQNFGKDVDKGQIHPFLFPFQRDLAWWTMKKGRAAIFADTGLGKTYMQLEWARLMDERTLIIAPLSVARQTVRLAKDIDMELDYVRDERDAGRISITNYEMMERFDPSHFGAVVLDESSILKCLAGKTRKKLIEMFQDTPYRLCCTATPAPNDIAEIANHAEFLGIMSHAEMMACFFVHDDQGWRLKGHAQDAFYRWLASWGMSVKKPSDLGYDDDGFLLPSLSIEPFFVPVNYVPDGQLFFTVLKGIQDRNSVRKATMNDRIAKVAELVNSNDEQWIAWCGLNAESSAVAQCVSDAVEVKGSDDADFKASTFEDFQDGKFRVLVTKPRIGGFGMNFQNCFHQVFVGLGDSWEAYYQCIRRSWRFGQQHPVAVNVVLSDPERAIWHNVQRKNDQAEKMSKNLIGHVQNFERMEMQEETMAISMDDHRTMKGKSWTAMRGDCVERMKEIPDESVDFSVFSPPFMDLYTYTPEVQDLGNSRTEEEFFDHFGFVIQGLLRITKPGRNCAVHTADVPAMLLKDGHIGLKDFPGKVIRAFEKEGWIYHGRVTIDKNPQAQAIRTHSKALLFNQLKKDSIWSRPALGDYILVFRKPGENRVPIHPDVDNETWIAWAHPIWTGINETETLQYRQARGEDDDKHICPLQLGTIERCIRLWSNPGETVFSPFGGIGSEGYKAVELEREAIMIELKEEYFDVMIANMEQIERKTTRLSLFDNERE